MQPIRSETITDRRQPAIRWSAVLAGTAVAAGLWGVLQLLGIGAGLTAIDPEDVGSASTAIGVGALSLLAPLIAMLVGGYVAAKLSGTYDQKVAGAHGLVVWGLTALIGLGTTLWLAKTVAVGAAHMRAAEVQQVDARAVATTPDASLLAEAKEVLMPINQRLRLQGKPQISPDQLISAARSAADDDGFDVDELIEELDDKTALSRDEAADVATQLGPRAQALVGRASAVTPAQHDAMKAAERTGQGLLSLGAAILLSIGTATLGALLALGRFGKRGRDDDARRRGPYTTAPYPTTPPTSPTVTPPAGDR